MKAIFSLKIDKLATCILILTTLFITCKSKTQLTTNTFKYNLAVGVGSLDPAFSKELATIWACSHLYEGLFILDSNAELKPLLIKNYTLSSDNLIYSFQLKKGVRFHKNICFGSDSFGREMTAYDVEYSLKRLIDPKTASPGAWVLKNKLDSILPFKIIDSFTIEIKLRKPNAQFLQVLSMPYCSVIPKEAVDFYGKNFRKNPVGTGPFMFKLWDDGTVLFLEKNTNYYLFDEKGKRLPYLDFIKITFNEQKKTELLSFEKGDLSFITGLDQTMIQEAFNINGQLNEKWKSKANLSLKPFLNTEYFAILMKDDLLAKNAILGSKSIRKAINYAINRRELVQYLKYNLVLPAIKGVVSAGMPNYDTSFSGYDYNPELAKKLVNEYIVDKANKGLGMSNQKPKIEIHINNSFVEMAEFLENELEKVGFDIEIKLHPADMMMQLATEGKIDFFRRSWFADYPDAENYFSCFYSKNSCPPNYTRFSNKEFDRLYEESILEQNPANRKTNYKKMEQILKEESPIVPIFYDQSIRLIQKNISGLNQNVLNTLDLRRVSILK